MGSAPMTSAERQRRSRLKLKQEGGTEYQIRINKQQLDAIKLLAHYKQHPQTKTKQSIKKTLQQALDHVTGVMQEVEKMSTNSTDNEIISYIGMHIFPSTPRNKGGVITNNKPSSRFTGKTMHVRTRLKWIRRFLCSLKGGWSPYGVLRPYR